MSAKLLIFLATIAGRALGGTTAAPTSTASSNTSSSGYTFSIAPESFAPGTTTISIYGPGTNGSILGVSNCETTMLAADIEHTYTYTQGPSDFQYNFNTFSDGFSYIETSSCTFVTSSIASFSMVALCKETYYGSEDGAVVTDVLSSTLYPDQLVQLPITVSGDLSQLASASGACTPTAKSTSTSASTSGSVSGSMGGSMGGSTSGSMTGSVSGQTTASTPSSTHNAAPTNNVYMAAGIGAAAMAGLALL